MGDDICLDVTAGYVDDCKIIQQQYHSFIPCSSTALDVNDEVRFDVRNMDSYVLPSKSFLYLEGRITKPTGLPGNIRFINNGLVYLFSEFRLEINGIQVQKLRYPGIASTLKTYCSRSPSDIFELHNTVWDLTTKDNHDFFNCEYFSGTIPLSHIMGFAEDYKKILINCSISLICTRSINNMDAIKILDDTAVNKENYLRLL